MMWLTDVASVPLILIGLVLGGIVGFVLARRRPVEVDSEQDHELTGPREQRGNLRHQLHEADETPKDRTEELKDYETELQQLRERIAELEQQADPDAIAAMYAGLSGNDNPTPEELLVQGEQLRQRLRDELDHLRDRVEELEHDGAEAHEQQAKTDERLGEEKQRTAGLERELQDKARYIENIEHDLNHHRDWVQRLEKELGETQARVDSLEWELKDKQDQLEAAGASLSARSEERNALQEEVTNSRDRISTLGEELKQKQGERETTEQQLRAQLADLQHQLKERDTSLTKLTENLRSESARAGEHEASARSLERRLKQSELDLESTRNDAATEQENSRTQKSQLQQQEAELTAQREALASAEKNLAEEREALSELRVQLEQNGQQLLEKDTLLSELQQELKQTKKEHSSQQAEFAILQGELEHKSGALTEARQALQEEQTSNEETSSSAQEQVQQLRDELQALRAELHDKTAAAAELQQRVEQSQEALDHSQQAKAAELEQTSARIASLDATSTAQDTQIAEQEARLATQAQRIAELEALVQEKDSAVAALEEELENRPTLVEVGTSDHSEDTEDSSDDDVTQTDALQAAAVSLSQSLSHARGQSPTDDVEVAKRQEQRFAALGAGLAAASRGLGRFTNGASHDADDENGHDSSNGLHVEEPDALSERLQQIAAEHAVDHEDDLSRVQHIGTELAALLTGEGVRNYLQLALLDAAAQRALEQRLALTTERARRDNWSTSAAQLQQEVHGQALDSALLVPASAESQALRADGDADHLARRLRELAQDGASPDDLTRVRGIDGAQAQALRDLGITRYKQLALLDDAAADTLETRLGLAPNQLRRSNWAGRAAQLHFEEHDEALYDQVQLQPIYENAFERLLAETARGKRLDYRDDLKKIKGLGPKMEELLNESGLHTYWQLSQLNEAAVEALDGVLDSLANRIRRGKWIEQAASLHRKYHG